MKMILTYLLCLLATSLTHADSFESTFLAGQGDFSVQNAKFSNHAIYELRQTWFVTKSVGLELGFNTTTKAEDEGSDVKGQYKSTLKTQDFLAGFKFSTHVGAIHNAYIRMGASYGEATISIEESFGGLREGGSDEQSHNGQGYYWGIGFGSWVHHRLQLGIDATQYTKQDVFKGKSEHPFDLTSSQLAFFGTYAF